MRLFTALAVQVIVTIGNSFFIHHMTKRSFLAMLNQREQQLITSLTDAFNRYTTNAGKVIADATAALEAAKAEHGTDSEEFTTALDNQVAVINAAADHLQSFTAAPSSPEAPVPVIEEAVIAAPVTIAADLAATQGAVAAAPADDIWLWHRVRTSKPKPSCSGEAGQSLRSRPRKFNLPRAQLFLLTLPKQPLTVLRLFVPEPPINPVVIDWHNLM